ncbi:accessory gland protein Acp62F-like [Drosophila biarmipes]|uniref:accessory gland protein Acp62F-like n=1 Tax=Drosophila biarmipes TaxID=125945 RepID=UPI0021CC7B88|nr:accessory gland protein Acp62F-like [Drosophila biarmipes]
MISFLLSYVFIKSTLALASLELETTKIDCSANGTLQKCPSPCPETCEFLSASCFNKCGGPCVCKEGYIIDPDRRICVLKSDCPASMRQTTLRRHYPVNIEYFGSYILFNLTDYKSIELKIPKG